MVTRINGEAPRGCMLEGGTTLPIRISNQTRKALLDALNLRRLVDVMDRDFMDIDEAHDVDRGKAVRYASRNRGSVRINTGRFYTAKEHSDRIARAKRLKLP